MTTTLARDRGEVARYNPSSLGVAVLPVAAAAFQSSEILRHTSDSGMSKSSNREQISERANRALRRRAKVSSEPSSPPQNIQQRSSKKAANKRLRRSSAYRVSSAVATSSINKNELRSKSRKLTRKVIGSKKSDQEVNLSETPVNNDDSPTSTIDTEKSSAVLESSTAVRQVSETVTIDESSELNRQDSGADSTSMITDDMDGAELQPIGSTEASITVKDDDRFNTKHAIYKGSLSASSLRKYRRKRMTRSGGTSGRCFVGNALMNVVLDRKRLQSLACSPVTFDELNFLSYPCRADGGTSNHVIDNVGGRMKRSERKWFSPSRMMES